MFTFSWSPYPSDETIHKGLDEGHNGYYKNYHYHPIVLGSIIRSSNTLPGPSYRDIKAQTVINRDGTGAPANKAEIKDNAVYLNDVLIATSPAGKNKAQKEKFCKAIVWSLMNDPISLQDKLLEISNRDKPVMVQEDLTVDIGPDDHTIMEMTITNEEITGYPVIDLIEQMSDEEKILLNNGMFSSGLSIHESIEKGFDCFEDDHFSDILHIENLKGILPEILPEKIQSIVSVISTRFIPWLNLTITEEVIA